ERARIGTSACAIQLEVDPDDELRVRVTGYTTVRYERRYLHLIDDPDTCAQLIAQWESTCSRPHRPISCLSGYTDTYYYRLVYQTADTTEYQLEDLDYSYDGAYPISSTHFVLWHTHDSAKATVSGVVRSYTWAEVE